MAGNNQEFNFEVTTNLQNGTIIETYVDGERESIQECHFHFEFSSGSRTHPEFPFMASIILIPRLPSMQDGFEYQPHNFSSWIVSYPCICNR